MDACRERWGLPGMEWRPQEGEMARDGTHLHLPAARRIDIYAIVSSLTRQRLPEARIGLCKETRAVRKAVRLCEAVRDCL